MQPIGRNMPRPHVLDEFAVQIAHQRAALIEERIKLVPRVKPRWLPERLWRVIIARLIVLQTETL